MFCSFFGFGKERLVLVYSSLIVLIPFYENALRPLSHHKGKKKWPWAYKFEAHQNREFLCFSSESLPLAAPGQLPTGSHSRVMARVSVLCSVLTYDSQGNTAELLLPLSLWFYISWIVSLLFGMAPWRYHTRSRPRWRNATSYKNQLVMKGTMGENSDRLYTLLPTKY